MGGIFKEEDPAFTIRWKERQVSRATSRKALSRQTVGGEGAWALAPDSESCLHAGVWHRGKRFPSCPKHLI